MRNYREALRVFSWGAMASTVKGSRMTNAYAHCGTYVNGAASSFVHHSIHQPKINVFLYCFYPDRLQEEAVT